MGSDDAMAGQPVTWNGTLISFVNQFTGRQGRKVAFGIWVFWIASLFLKTGVIDKEMWWHSTILSALMIGFGTILDTFVERVTEAMASFAAEKIALVLGRRTTDVVVTVPKD